MRITEATDVQAGGLGPPEGISPGEP